LDPNCPYHRKNGRDGLIDVFSLSIVKSIVALDLDDLARQFVDFDAIYVGLIVPSRLADRGHRIVYTRRDSSLTDSYGKYKITDI
jgi:hypothetical protein